MNITSYAFQSPYPHQLQKGRSDLQTVKQETQKEKRGNTARIDNQIRQEIEIYSTSAVQSSTKINVANSSNDNGLNASLAHFSKINGQMQAFNAYS